jgi:hypothetical protein
MLAHEVLADGTDLGLCGVSLSLCQRGEITNRMLHGPDKRVALLSNFGPVVLMDFGPPPVPQPTVARVDRGAWRGLESQSGFVRAATSGA